MSRADDELDAFREALDRATASVDRAPFVDDDGTAYVWDATLERYVGTGAEGAEAADAEAADARARMTYAADEEADARRAAVETLDAIVSHAKALVDGGGGVEARKREAAMRRAAERARDARAKRAKRGFEASASTAVYVSGLPRDCADEELYETFKKCGVVKLDARDGKPRARVYADENGEPKGDGLVVFLKAPSVDLAITLLDGAELRPGDASTVMSVSAATFEAKEDGGGKARGKGMTKEERKRAAAMLRRQEAEALGWSGFDDEVDKKKLIVILRRMFKLEEMYADANLRKELEEDVLEEAQRTCGPVESVKTYTTSKDGTMTIRFKSIEAAEACVAAWNGRWFDGRQIEASIWDGRSKFVSERDESEAAQKARLDAYAAELGGEDEEDGSEEEEEE